MANEQLVIGHDFNNGGGRYWIELDAGSAELTYRNRGDGVIVIDHTFVPPEARGGKIAQKLVERAAEDARKSGLKIVPQCPYVNLLFKRRADLNELRAD
ncbi:MAG: N-acetyltransferase [Marinicaulis sp.]|nr:N-acetyltransferase [Marinicaulis sp.]NNE40344.1 N-acetyltransferase [Marinicaulis sp.]NNL88228.1 N-acetyltransferase [Marinicaulis sp.]